uniref:Misato Segment II tubulin-like domain-containing protein n=1 Tax=Ciona savignyi TaxID=51511 RepID=H2ZRB4_CIOSA
SYSNFVGTHFWNIQESSFNYDGTEGEINHDILFREGLTPNGDVTFTPRLVFVDLKQNLGSLSSQGKLYSETNNVFEIPTWDKHCEVIASERNVRNEFIEDLYLEDESYRNNSDCCKAKDKEYKLDGQIDYWSDFKRLHYHPRSALTIDARDPLGGVDPKVSFNVEETVRFYAEECDTLQGFQFLCDASSCDLLSPTLEHLTQDYHGKSLHVYPVQPIHQRQSLSEIRTHDLSVLFSLSESIKNSSIVSPMSLNCDLFNKNNQKRDFPA